MRTSRRLCDTRASFEASPGFCQFRLTRAYSGLPQLPRPAGRRRACWPVRSPAGNSLSKSGGSVQHQASRLRAWLDDASGFPVFPTDDLDGDFGSMVRKMEEMQRRMDSEMDRMIQESREMQRQAEKKLLDSPSRIEIKQWQYEGGNGYGESVIISFGPDVQGYKVGPPVGMLLGVVLALMAACLYAVGTYVFNRNFDVTTFNVKSRWQLSILWPFLLLFSPKFRKQFLATLAAREKPTGEGHSEQDRDR